MATTVMFLSQRYMKENERLRQELSQMHAEYADQIAEKELMIDDLREQLSLMARKSDFPSLTSPTSTIDFSEDEYSLDPREFSYNSLLSIPSLPLSKTEEEEEEEVITEKQLKVRRSLSKIRTSSIVRKLSKKKKKFFRKKARRRGTPLPTTHEQGDFDEGANMNHETTTVKTTSSGWSREPLLPMSPIKSRPRRTTFSSTTHRVRQLPREQSLSNLSDDDTTAPEGDELHDDVLSQTIEVQSHQVNDAVQREGMYTGTIDRTTQLPDGYGSMSYSDGSHYKGYFQQGNWHGKATFRNQNGDMYHGYFVNNKKEGTGILSWGAGSDGQYEKFEGRFQDDMMREGKMLYANTGSFYEGLFKGGCRHGFGAHKSSDGYEFEGQWHMDKMHGHGKVIMPCGGWYNGDFKSGVAHGLGMEVNSNGAVQHEGRWDSGYPVFYQ